MRTEDGYLISKCLNDEPEAFGLLVDKYKTGIYAFVYAKIRDLQDAQDVTQEVFIQAYRNLHSLRRWDSFVSWLYSIASVKCRKLIRKKLRHPVEFIEDQSPDILESPSLVSYRENLVKESLQEALESLPENYREVVMMHYFGGMRITEIAKTLGISSRTVDRWLSIARSQLREEMLSMIGETFKEQKLPTSFTFRIVEAAKRTKIHPVSQMKGLPWGLSLATGLLITILSINPTLTSFNQIGMPVYSPLAVESKVLKLGEIPVDVVKTTNMAIISSGIVKGGEPENIQNAFHMAPNGEGGTWKRKTDIITMRGGLSGSVLSGKIYTIGGFNNEGRFKTIEEYDPIADKWIGKTDMPTGRGFFSASEIGGKIYVVGGFSKCPENTVPELEEYTPDGWQPEQSIYPQGKLPKAWGELKGR